MRNWIFITIFIRQSVNRTYRVENGHEEGEDGAHVQVEHGLLLTVLGVDHDKVVVVDAGDADHQDWGDDEAGVVHGEAQQQRVHGAGHGGSDRQNDFKHFWVLDLF